MTIQKVTGGFWMPLVYVATPYSDPDPAVREERIKRVNAFCDELVRLRIVFYQPRMKVRGKGGAIDWWSWRYQDREILFQSDVLVVYQQPGWKRSKRVKEEINLARSLDMSVVYHDLETPVAGGPLEKFYASLVSREIEREKAKERNYREAKSMLEGLARHDGARAEMMLHM